jgi:hypothetical protein
METINVNELLDKLSDKQKQLLKDTIINGCWGTCDSEFVNEKGIIIVSNCVGYVVNLAKEAGHFNGRQISAMFRSIYSKLCPNNGTGNFLSHISNYWDNGSGDALFIKRDYVIAFERWARE